MRGKLFFYYGCMSSGKSMHLLASAHNFQAHGIPFIIFKSEIDDRDGENVIHSRALGDRECISISKTDNLYNIVAEYVDNELLGAEPIKWILVDEAQFLTAEQVDQLSAVCDMIGISVMCYGLRTDFQTHLFEGSRRLFEVADTLEEIKSSCFCNHKTIFNARVKDGKVVTDGDQVEIGGDDKYVSLCRKCYFEKINNPLYNKKEKGY